MELVTDGLQFPEGPVITADGSILLVEIRRGTLTRVLPGGQHEVVGQLGGGPNGAAIGPDGALYVTGPTLSSYDPLYRIAEDGTTEVVYASFGRPQGLAFDRHGSLFVVEALAGASGLYRVRPGLAPELVVAGAGLVGVAFSSDGMMIVASNETAYRLPRPA